jgi:translation initiation factor 2 subunit 3
MESIDRQPVVNIGVIGHVAHGKSTFVKNISGSKTQKHSKELISNKTIYLGYANTKIYRCQECPSPHAFSTRPNCDRCERESILVNHVSFIDCPGHDELMATMLNGVSMMDYVILVIAANEPFPRPQTLEHFLAAKMMGVKNLVVLQNKIDLVTRAQALKQYEEVRKFLVQHSFDQPIVIPFACHQSHNRPHVLHYIANFKEPERMDGQPVKIYISRSFDVNPGQVKPPDIKGGVIGGTVIEGVVRVGDRIEIKPGLITKSADGRIANLPIITHVRSIETDRNPISEARPGGLIGLETNLDPFLTQKNRLVGQLAGLPGTLPDVSQRLAIKYVYLDRKEAILSSRDAIRLNINSGTFFGEIEKKKRDQKIIYVLLGIVVCVRENQLVAISKKIGSVYRLVGYGHVTCYF